MSIMQELVLDFETTFQLTPKGAKDPSPFHPDNYIVSVGYQTDEGICYDFYSHNYLECTENENQIIALKEELAKTDLLICQNAKFELSWLKAIGIEYDGKVFDTMLAAYVLAKGEKYPLSLASLCERYGVQSKKSELVDRYLKENIGFEVIPWEIVEEYGRGDIVSTRQLADKLKAELDAQPHLWPIVDLMNEMCQCITYIENNGMAVDVNVLNELQDTFGEEFRTLNRELEEIVASLCGDLKINLDSPEELSNFIYSRRVKDKKLWKETFNLGSELRGSVRKIKRKVGMSSSKFVEIVKEQTEPVLREQHEQCRVCNGSGKTRRTKSNGEPWAKLTVCKPCEGRGYTIRFVQKIGGLRTIPLGSNTTAIGGFGVDGNTLNSLREKVSDVSGNIATSFLTKLERRSNLSVHLNTTLDGIRRGLRDSSNILHPQFMQTTTATGRLSSKNPNAQNLPRGNTFPIRKVFVSRFENGCITEADGKQLEFRIFGELSGSPSVFEDIANKVDVHAVTAKYTGLSRQDSKSHTFAPVYGATSRGKAAHIEDYYEHFIKRHKVAEFHNRMASEIIRSGGYYRLPTGKEFFYRDVRRYPGGGFTQSTQIANYPVQYMATGELVPMACIAVWRLLTAHNLKSCIVLTVHDSVAVDTHPDEQGIVANLMRAGLNSIKDQYKLRFNYDLKMPIEWELKRGPNLLEMEEI